MAEKRVKWGIIGASSWAKNTFGPAIMAAENGQLCAVLSSNQAKAEKLCQKLGIPTAYSDLDAFLSDPNVEAVWVASPNHMHARQSIAALQRGKHVLCEKPMATTVEDGERMIDAADKAGKLLSVGYHMRHHPLHQRLRDDWIAGKLGEPICIRAQLYFAYPRPPAEWRQHRATSGGWAICDVGTHLIDLLRWFLGDATDVHAEMSSLKFGYETDDHAVVTIRFANGALGLADASTGAGAPAPRLELYGSDQYCICEGTLFGTGGRVSTGKLSHAPNTTDAEFAALYQLQAESFGRAILDGKDLQVTARDGLENVKIIEQARGY
ncbi:MAG: Gfo/Idh/MocA family oxidoreductase [Phycisphaerae bacterium]|nr:Gfo/Idh/MocA family oxidoreductase [Phycisphaerae bacterium]